MKCEKCGGDNEGYLCDACAEDLLKSHMADVQRELKIARENDPDNRWLTEQESIALKAEVCEWLVREIEAHRIRIVSSVGGYDILDLESIVTGKAQSALVALMRKERGE